MENYEKIHQCLQKNSIEFHYNVHVPIITNSIHKLQQSIDHKNIFRFFMLTFSPCLNSEVNARAILCFSSIIVNVVLHLLINEENIG